MTEKGHKAKKRETSHFTSAGLKQLLTSRWYLTVIGGCHWLKASLTYTGPFWLLVKIKMWLSRQHTVWFCYQLIFLSTFYSKEVLWLQNRWWRSSFPDPLWHTDEKQLAYIFVCLRRRSLKTNTRTWGPFCLVHSPPWHLGPWLTAHNRVTVVYHRHIDEMHVCNINVKGNIAEGERKLSSQPQEIGLP